MPGIVGFLSASSGDQQEDLLTPMVKTMLHERFYTSGAYVNKEMGLAVGWVCHPGSFSDCLPIWNETKDVCLLFSGENFADKVELDRLRAAGHQFSRDTAGYLVHLYEESGQRFFEMLNGSFSGVLVDLREKKAMLFNDRYGLNRIYYHESPAGLYFASEAKSLLKVLPQLRQLDMRSLGEFFVCGSAMQDRTLFSGVSLLPCASVWTHRPGRQIEKERFFRADNWENLPSLSSADYYEKLSSTFARILPRYFEGRQRVALSLTGGLDSRMIIACAPSTPFKLPCYTFGGLYRECADVTIARHVARVCQQSHEVIQLNRKFFSEFPALAKRSVYFTDGALDVTGAVGLFVNRFARDIAPVRLTGNYGDEVLRWNVPFGPRKDGAFNQSIFASDFAVSLQAAKSTYTSERKMPTSSFIAFKQMPWHHYARLAMEQTQLTVRSPYLDNDLMAVSYQAPTELRGSVDLPLRIIADAIPLLAKIPTDRGFVGRPGTLGRRLREQHRRFTVKAEYTYDYGMPEWLAKFDTRIRWLHAERFFLGRNKYYHFRRWYRDELSHYVKDILLDRRALARPYLDGRHVEKLVKAHIAGQSNHTLEIHSLLTAELMQRQLIEQR